MKKLTAIILLSGSFISLFAGEPGKGRRNFISGDGAKCYDENSHVINVGIGLASGYYYGRVSGEKYSSSPYMSVSYEQAWKKKLGPGFLGVGAHLGYKTEKYSKHYNSGYYYEKRYSYYNVFGRATYHWDVLNSEKAEVYGGVLVGIQYHVYNYYDNDLYNDYYGAHRPAHPHLSAFAGARYYFTNNIGVFAEVGVHRRYDATVGLSIKF